MTQVSNDPIWWPLIDYYHVHSFSVVACFIIVLYDWVLTFGEEVELIWRQRWSLMTGLYISVRYTGMAYTVKSSVSFIERCSVAVNILLGVIMIIRLHAMYQQSRKILIFLGVIFLGVQVTCTVIVIVVSRAISGAQDVTIPIEMTWILTTAWEILAMCLAVWIAVKHFRELREPSARWAVNDCFTILIKTHVFYFASFVVISCIVFTTLSPTVANSTDIIGIEFLTGFLSIANIVQMFVLGPRLILGLREHHAKLVAHSDEGTLVTTIYFQERIHIKTGGGV
ncbi:hypothetical protein K503DRAFT_783740 [Rhizopogon vinicolor AM-OR11-026]|uniref:DUF6533 domain-containing protein n=1 Tax=Rhizopogon vinicolor AM-OR11-026 TaxID=1314800 RepID=A0A1B7MXD5_9AGAM|nr:hypothetical protein K503DRAFT_783740 [Rhizopogon vinicolor AM-OR11-026]